MRRQALVVVAPTGTRRSHGRPFDHHQRNSAWHHFYDPMVLRNTGTVELVVVETQGQADIMRDRGYVEMPPRFVYSRHSSIEELPRPLALPSETPLHLQPPPPDTEPAAIPSKVPKLRKEGPGDNRDKLIECFEVKVVDEEEGTVYSPMRRWKELNTTAVSRAFSSRLRGYYAVKMNLLLGETRLSELAKAASDHPDILAKKEHMKSSNQKFSFFEVCCDLYEEVE
mmetsp:Transcript_15582/g.33690  ORF Transcript_15582/g.33690 Transcript_15582/m.33690 type:complete len:226 (-) Transcript_15582:74-751(-)